MLERNFKRRENVIAEKNLSKVMFPKRYAVSFRNLIKNYFLKILFYVQKNSFFKDSKRQRFFMV